MPTSRFFHLFSGGRAKNFKLTFFPHTIIQSYVRTLAKNSALFFDPIVGRLEHFILIYSLIEIKCPYHPKIESDIYTSCKTPAFLPAPKNRFKFEV